MGNPTALYLPLLTNADPAVRRQVGVILLATYGERGITYLRRLLDDPDPEVCRQARAALLSLAETSGLHIALEPFRGIYVRCLGELQVFVHGREVQPQDWSQAESGRAGGRKVQGIFAYLVHCGRRGSSRADLAEAVWGGSVSAASFSRTIGALRQMLTQLGSPEFAVQALIVDRDHCALSPGTYLCDADHFERTYDLATQREEQSGIVEAAALYHQVIALYDGPYMQAIPRASDWGAERRMMIDNSFVIAAERLASHAWEQGNDRQCVLFCRRALEIDPTADDVVAMLLRAYDHLGLRIDIEDTYRRYIERSGVDPGCEREDAAVAAYIAIGEAAQL
ncbi:bacterial transcriptional activator domain-containing protein [Oscillochloris sp. ZM17-4]|uniref:BTAD domain-containing protein n=1 Tax=Oscillochloris sp. ZM17-4 TaxID=2866714 RepID=UPI001C738532|nr:BTAD domain-containing protein [Oscillochloris sp. ZM17-4]MBX0328132.1 bacterial transcriptional activator domain-containing protein [Oscillochloris sp. ZM17-4]